MNRQIVTSTWRPESLIFEHQKTSPRRVWMLVVLNLRGQSCRRRYAAIGQEIMTTSERVKGPSTSCLSCLSCGHAGQSGAFQQTHCICSSMGDGVEPWMVSGRPCRHVPVERCRSGNPTPAQKSTSLVGADMSAARRPERDLSDSAIRSLECFLLLLIIPNVRSRDVAAFDFAKTPYSASLDTCDKWPLHPYTFFDSGFIKFHVLKSTILSVTSAYAYLL